MNDNDDPKKIITPDVDLRNRSLFKDDLMFFPKLIYSGLSYKYDLARGRVSTWYWFENSVFRVPNKLALIYPKNYQINLLKMVIICLKLKNLLIKNYIMLY